ncbi:MAG: hypothetical protein VBE63_24135 [Lamprobacter sp.]|uniref:hypothetical protein n=1 Tax=Lamprobacter sp. TaxID=3100796 RepID=UPI002B25F560|nr:hypothetical protein [Lamprobacter sp.]MEA3643005.1 hypothetical protein [Lamprobacter sp.]
MMTKDTTTDIPNCPPHDAEPATGRVYRCAKSNPAKARDMQIHAEKGSLPNAAPCLRRALSAFRSQRDAEHQIRLFRRWKRRFVLFADLNHTHGKVKLTSGQQPTHTSWWPASSLSVEDRASLFSLIREVP